jgi:hypothetical protein
MIGVHPASVSFPDHSKTSCSVLVYGVLRAGPNPEITKHMMNWDVERIRRAKANAEVMVEQFCRENPNDPLTAVSASSTEGAYGYAQAVRTAR